jgi:aquaporin Z
MAKKFVAELIGTFVLVYVACGVATMTLGHFGVGAGATQGWGINGGILTTALTFGLVLAGLAYAIGPLSGCHVNPAVTLGMWIDGRMTATEALGYIGSQFVGAILGAGALLVTLDRSPRYSIHADGLGADGFGAASKIHISWAGAFIVEVVLTAVFVFVILKVTTRVAHAATAGLIIGTTLVFCHLFAIPVDGTSVNPARSFGPALFVGGTALSQVWLFLIAPLVGGALAAGVFRFLKTSDE